MAIKSRGLGFVLLATCVACSSGKSGADACTPGQSIQCAGVNGCVGAQVCNSDGSGYDACICDVSMGGSNSGIGGAKSTGQNGSTPVGGNAPNQWITGGAGSVTATGGRSSTTGTDNPVANTGGAGGTTSSNGGSANCTPKSMTGYSYPGYKAARRVANACTEQAIQQYYTDCYSAGNCSAFEGSGSLAQCGACLAPTDLTAANYGPLLKMGTSSLFFYETNVAGCEELVGEVNCAPKMQVEFLCEYYACTESCPLADGTGYNAMFQCMSSAQASTCAQLRTAATCLTSTAHVAACSGTTFQAQFLTIAKVFCL